MRLYIPLLLILLFPGSVFPAPDYSPEVKNEFRKFFGETIPDVILAGKVHLITDDIYESPDQMVIKMKFGVKDVEKVLLLNVRSNGYSREGLFYVSCAKEPVFIAGYNFNGKNNPTELETRLRTSCIAHQIILMMWVKTKNGYYLDTAAFQTTSESPGE